MTEPDEERRSWLQERLNSAIPGSEPPFVSEDLTREDVDWLVTRQLQLTPPGADTQLVDLRGCRFFCEDLTGIDLDLCLLDGADFYDTHLEGANLMPWYPPADASDIKRITRIRGASFYKSHLAEAQLNYSDLSGVKFRDADLKGADLRGCALFGSDEYPDGTDLAGAEFDTHTNLNQVRLSARHRSGAVLRDVRWGGTDLSVIDYRNCRRLGDEDEIPHILPLVVKAAIAKTFRWLLRTPRATEMPNESGGTITLPTINLPQRLFWDAARATRQFAVALKDQGLDIQATRFQYRERVLHRKELFWSPDFFGWLGSLILAVVSGYGYRPLRSVIVYALTITGFALGYHALGSSLSHAMSWPSAFDLSVTSFHGRGLFSSPHALSDAIINLTAAEAVVGLLIEIMFVATFARRVLHSTG